LKNPPTQFIRQELKEGSNSPFSDFSLESQNSMPYDGRFLHPGSLVDHPNPMMPLLDAIWTRRTSRSYAAKKVPQEVFDWLVAQAMNAPTACNEQQWKIIHIDDPDIITDLYERGSASFLLNAKQCFLVCYNHNTDNREWLDHVQSGAAFVTMFQLIAHCMGIGSCWIGHLPNKSELRRIFKIHRSYDPVALVSYGYYRNKVRTLPRKHDVGHIIMENRFFSDRLVLGPNRGTLFRTIGRYIYYKIPAFLRRKLRNYTKPYEKKFYYEEFD